jgi:two-component system, NtrC family, response regulator AlgB
MHVLIIEDEAGIRKTTRMAIEACGHTVVEAGNAARALRVIGESEFNAIFLDLKLGEDDGIELLTRIKAIYPNQIVVMFTAYATVATAINAVKCGAFDFIPKPFTPQAIRDMLVRIGNIHLIEKTTTHHTREIPPSLEPAICLDSKEYRVQRAFDGALKAAPTLAPILIRGDKGTGKRSLAHEIHKRSSFKESPFLEIQGRAIRKEILNEITEGTVYVHEIAEIELELQGYFLHWLEDIFQKRLTQTREVSKRLRFIASSSHDLETYVKKGIFREDLLYRLNVVSVQLPCLHERVLDFEAVCEKTISFYCERVGRPALAINPEVITQLKHYAWPENFREFNRVIKQAVTTATGNKMELHDLPIDWKKGLGLKLHQESSDLHAHEAELIERVIQESRNLDEAAHKLGIAPSTLYRKRQKLGLS